MMIDFLSGPLLKQSHLTQQRNLSSVITTCFLNRNPAVYGSPALTTHNIVSLNIEWSVVSQLDRLMMVIIISV